MCSQLMANENFKEAFECLARGRKRQTERRKGGAGRQTLLLTQA